MNKYLIFIAILLIFSVFTISAQGSHRGYGNTPYYGDDRFETKEYSGKLTLKEGKLPEVEAGKIDIQLLIPVETVDNLELSDGKEIRVKGLEFRKRFFVFKGKHVLMVNEIETDGNTYFIENNMQMRGVYGRRGCW